MYSVRLKCKVGGCYNTTTECKGGVIFPGHFHSRFGQEMLESLNQQLLV